MLLSMHVSCDHAAPTIAQSGCFLHSLNLIDLCSIVANVYTTSLRTVSLLIGTN